jgi:ribosomal protein S18 acetylase RimI-like enzyme
VDNDSPAVRAEHNLIRAFQMWSAAAGGRTWESEGFTCVSNPVPKRAFNHIFVTSATARLDEVRKATTWYAENGHPLRVRVRPVIDKEFGTLASIDLRCEGAMPGMFFRGDLAPARETGLRIDRVRDQQGLDAMIALVGECFDWPPEYLAQIYNRALMETPGWYAWVGYEADEPATTGQTAVHEGTAGLYHIATTAKHRRKGYGDAITRACLEEGFRQGCDMATLYASALGYPVYKRIGFEDSGEYLTYGQQ